MNVTFGALSPPLSRQLAGVQSREVIRHWQRDADAITRLAVRGLLTEREVGNARLRLCRQIRESVGAAAARKVG